MEKLVIIAGPTASGKSNAAVQLSKRLNGSVISADSIQVYKGMDIGSAKITEDEKQGIDHYLIDIIDPSEEWNAVVFQRMAKDAIHCISAQGKLPFMAGGTGFYIQSLLYDIDFSVTETDNSLRDELQRFAMINGPQALHDMLAKLDPKAAEEIHPNNIKRLIRAIEYARQTGEKISDHNDEQRLRPPAYDCIYFVLTMDRKKLYERINYRVDLMLQQGLVDEVLRLKALGFDTGYVSMQGLGYKQILEYLDGKYSLDEAVEQIKLQTRHFAKRQLTWFKREQLRNPDIIFIETDQFDSAEEMLDHMENMIRTHYKSI